MSRRLIVSVAALLLAISALMALAPAASAAPCAAGGSCIWRDEQFMTNGDTSKKVRFEARIPNFGNWTYAGTSLSAANSATSVTNEGIYERVYYYTNTSCGTFAFSLAVNTGDQHLNDSSGNVPGGYNNTVESGAFHSYVSGC